MIKADYCNRIEFVRENITDRMCKDFSVITFGDCATLFYIVLSKECFLDVRHNNSYQQFVSA